MGTFSRGGDVSVLRKTAITARYYQLQTLQINTQTLEPNIVNIPLTFEAQRHAIFNGEQFTQELLLHDLIIGLGV